MLDEGGSRRLNYWWRLFATGLSFQVFAIGGALLATAVAIVFLLIPSRLLCRATAMRFVISCSFKFYIDLLKWLGLLTYEIHGLQRLKPEGQFLIANHPTLLDVVFIFSLVRNADCVVRGGLLSNPLTAAPTRVAGYIKNVPENLLQRAADSLEKGNSLIVFPEGTRTKPDKALSLLRGAANIALIARKDLTPIVISCKPATLQKGQKWYHIPERPPHFRICVKPNIVIDRIVDSDMTQSKAARVLTRHLECYFESELSILNCR